jgi:hypothetical protein
MTDFHFLGSVLPRQATEIGRWPDLLAMTHLQWVRVALDFATDRASPAYLPHLSSTGVYGPARIASAVLSEMLRIRGRRAQRRGGTHGTDSSAPALDSSAATEQS